MQFKYPKEYTTSKYTIDGNRVVGVAEIKVIGEDPAPEPAPVSISYWNNPRLLSLTDFQKNIDEEGGMVYVLYDQTKEIASQATVGNKTGYFIQKSNCEPFTCSKYIINYGNKIFEIKLFPSSTNHLVIINQILSTFKFLQSSSQDENIRAVRSLFESRYISLGLDPLKVKINEIKLMGKYTDKYVVSYVPGSDYVGDGLYVLIGYQNGKWIMPESGDLIYCDWVKNSGADESTITFMGPTCK